MTIEQRCSHLGTNALGVSLHDVVAHALLSRCVADPMLLVCGGISEELTGTTNVSGMLTAHHAGTLHSVFRILLFVLLCWSGGSEVSDGIPFPVPASAASWSCESLRILRIVLSS